MFLSNSLTTAGVALFAGLLVGTAACDAPTASPTGSSSAPRAATVQARDFAFEPAELALSGGQPVRLTLVNSGAAEHDWTVTGLAQDGKVVDSGGHAAHGSDSLPAGTVHVSAQGGQQTHIEFTPKPGVYEYYCSVPGHREQGMRGALTVS